MNRFTLLSLTAIIIFINGCSKEEHIPQNPTITLKDKYLEMVVGDTKKLEFITDNKTKSQYIVQWMSTNPAAASIDTDGLIRAINLGETDIIAKYGDTGEDVCKLIVKPYVVKGIQIKESSIEVPVNSSYNLTLRIDSHPIINKDNIIWKSSDENIAYVNKSGGVVGIKEGECIVSAVTEDGKFTADCKVIVTPEKLINIFTLENYYLLEVGAVKVIKVHFVPEYAVNKNLKWGSTNPSVATIDEYGILTALKIGGTTVTAVSEDGGRKVSCEIEVAGIGNLIQTKFFGEFTNVNGYISGPIYLEAMNRSSKPATFFYFSITDSKTGEKIFEDDFSNQGIQSGLGVSKGAELMRVYKPVFTYYYQCDGGKYMLTRTCE